MQRLDIAGVQFSVILDCHRKEMKTEHNFYPSISDLNNK